MTAARPLASEDLPAVEALLREWQLGAAEGTRERLAGLAGNPLSCSVVMYDENGLAGVALAVFNGFHVFLSHIAVSPDLQNRGIGRKLHEAVEARARAHGAMGLITDAWLQVTGFYSALGYRMPGAVFLVKDLAP